jgi:tetratricopeptide (TPR) repeat protein
VRDIQQLKEVMPAEPNALVIVTSRAYLAYLGDSRSHCVEEPDTETAEQILRAYAGQKARGRPDRIAQIVEQCGRLPYALRAAGERALSEPNGLDGVATRMAERSTRLGYLSPEGRDTTDRIASEYANLMSDEQQAFRRLALVQAVSFVPWVLQPLLDVGCPKVGPVLARLREAQLVEQAGKDPGGAMRYRLHPLFRLFAERMLDEDDAPDEVEVARERLHRAYAATAGEVIKVLVPGFQPTVTCPPEHRPEGTEWPCHVARLTASWNLVEYANLIGAIHAAHGAGDWGTCWRIAASLRDAPAPADDYLIEPSAFRKSVTSAFVLAREAANLDSSTHGAAVVGLAEAVHRLAVEKHSAAHQLIEEHAGNGTVDQRRKAMALRLKAQSMQMLSQHRDATAVLTAALAAADAADDKGEQGRIRFLQMINDCVLRPESWKEVTSFEQAVDANQGTLKVSAYLWLAQAAARNGNDKGKNENIRLAYEEAGLCAAGRAEVLLADAEHGLADLASGGVADPEQVVRLAGHSVWAYQVLHCPLGVIRARVVLARVLLMIRRGDEADEQVREARQAYQVLGGAQFPALRAYLDLATGELGLYQEKNSASEALRQAMEFFEQAGHYWHAASARVAFGKALCAGGKYPAAFAELWQAVAELQNCGDTNGIETACAQLEIVHRKAGMPFNVTHRRQLRVLARPR